MDDYEIQVVDVLSKSEQLAFVMTKVGSFVVGEIPQAFTDARDAGILKRVNSIDEAREWVNKKCGNS